MQARYQMFNPEAIRPARRIYVGGLPNGTTEVRTAQLCIAHPVDVRSESGRGLWGGFHDDIVLKARFRVLLPIC